MKTFIPIAKISRPNIKGVFERERLFHLLDESREKPVVWVSGPAGSGKTTLVASWLDSRRLPCIWYRVDEGDADVASFFYYLGLAAKAAAPRNPRPLPLLTPEYLQGMPVFAQRYFEELFKRLRPPFVIVLDNYQDAPVESLLHSILSIGMSLVPEGVRFVVLSRNESPPQFSRLRAGDDMRFIGWKDIRFTLEESKNLVRSKDKRGIDGGALTMLHKKTDGWAAGLVLLIEDSTTRTSEHESLDNVPPREIFDYFANEIFEKTDRETREFLIKTALLPSMTSEIAETITHVKTSGQILSRLSRNNYFTEAHRKPDQVYNYHPLFRQFLLSRARGVLQEDDAALIRQQAAELFESSGQIAEAAALLVEARNWQRLTGLVLAHAPALLSQGRSKTLHEWLIKVPKAVIEKIPWLLFWLGVSRQAIDPPGSRAIFEQAFAAFEREADRTGALLSWAGIVETYWYEWNEFAGLDRWIEWFDRNVSLDAPHPSPDVETRTAFAASIALIIRRPFHPDISRWFDHAIALSRDSGNFMMRLQIYSIAIYYFAWTGERKKAETVIEEFRHLAGMPNVSPFVKLTWLTLEHGMRTLYSEQSGPALDNFAAALEFAQKNGIHTWDHLILSFAVYCCLSDGDVKRSDEFFGPWAGILDEAHRHGGSQYHIFMGWRHVLAGDHGKAVFHGELGLRIAEETGYVFPMVLCRFILAQILMLGPRRYPEAEALLSRAHQDAVRTNSKILQHMCLMAKAQSSRDRGRDADGLEFLRKGLAIGREENYTKMLWFWHGPTMAKLCARALEAGFETGYVREIIRKRRLAYPDAITESNRESKSPIKSFEDRLGNLQSDAWPWPIRIYTLGRFEILIEDKPVRFSGKSQKKPLELLKALIAFGGRHAAEERLSDALWPEADGDLARRSFDTTLYRLRGILRDDRFIQIKDGFLSLNTGYCWVDTWEFERMIEQAEPDLDGGTRRRGEAGKKLLSPRHPFIPSPAHIFLEKAISIYSGYFLPDIRQSWVLTARESLRNKYLRLVVSLGRLHEDAGRYEDAVQCFQKGLEVDELAEEFYQQLMLCHAHLGQQAEAVRVYRLCRSVLLKALGVEPSSRTTKIYKDVIKDSKSAPSS